MVILYSCGLVERRDQDLYEGTARLHATLADLAGRDLDELCDELLARMLPDNPNDAAPSGCIRRTGRARRRPAPNRVPPGFPVD